MRASSYNIYVELKKNPDYYFIAHGYSGAIDLLKKEYVVSLKKKNNEKLINEISKETFELLKTRGYITDITIEEEIKTVEIIGNFINKKNKEKGENHFLFVVTENCNFRCEYCFENDFSINGEEWSKKTFTKELVDKAYTAMVKIQPDRDKHAHQIGLYGGEPLLAENYEIVKYIVEEGIKRNYSFYAITNGYDLDKYIDLLGKDKIESLQITIDGLEEIHNNRRKHYLNKDSFSKIVENIDMAIKKEIYISIRSNIDNSNFNEVKRMYNFFKGKKWLEKKNFSYYPAPTYRNCHINTEINYRADFFEKINELKESKEQIYTTIKDISSIEAFLNNAIKNDSYLEFKPKFCGAHNGMLLFNSDGKIYPCWEVVGNSKHIIAIFDEKVSFTNSFKKWDNRTTINVEKCRKCKFALICGGGCAGKLVNRNIDINNPNCEDFPKIFSNMANLYYNKNLSLQLKEENVIL